MKINKKAFTLVELLVVVLIIGILAAIAVPQYQKAVYKSRLAILKPIVNSIVKAQDLNYLREESYTINPNELDIVLPTPVSEETNDKGHHYIYYDGWYCMLEGGKLAKCANEFPVLEYARYYAYANSNTARRGKSECCAQLDNSIAISICKDETGKTTPFWSDPDYNRACYSYED